MYAEIFEFIKNDQAVKDILGASPVRFFPFGFAPQDVALPYAVFQTYGGSPENHLNARPKMDVFSIQIDVYSDSAATARQASKALSYALEERSHVTRFHTEERNAETKRYRVGFDVDWWQERV